MIGGTSRPCRPEAAVSPSDGRLQAFFGALVDIGYRGPLTFESFSSAVVAPGLSNEAIWRNLWDDGADLASHARGFIDDGLRAGWQRHAS
jgi:D-psicose/D-tagatose/L-ribulose 3-epimerase